MFPCKKLQLSVFSGVNGSAIFWKIVKSAGGGAFFVVEHLGGGKSRKGEGEGGGGWGCESEAMQAVSLCTCTTNGIRRVMSDEKTFYRQTKIDKYEK